MRSSLSLGFRNREVLFETSVVIIVIFFRPERMEMFKKILSLSFDKSLLCREISWLVLTGRFCHYHLVLFKQLEERGLGGRSWATSPESSALAEPSRILQ